MRKAKEKLKIVMTKEYKLLLLSDPNVQIELDAVKESDAYTEALDILGWELTVKRVIK